MADENVATGTTTAQPQENWEARFKGQVPVIEKLTLENRSLKEQLLALTSEKEQFGAQIAQMSSDRTATVSEREKQIQALNQQVQALNTELAGLKAYKAKVEAIKKSGNMSLLKIADHIPAVEDPEAMSTVLNTFSQFAAEAVKERESQLFAGVTPPIAQQQAGKAVPSSVQDWEAYLNSLPLGSSEKNKAYDQYWEWSKANIK